MPDKFFENLVSDTLTYILKNTLNAYSKVECPDVVIGEDDDFWFSKEKRIEKKDKLDIPENMSDKQNIVIILESPHIAEYNNPDFINPALGTTGQVLQELIKKDAIIKLVNKNPSYRVILMNSIPFQCSLGQDTKIFRDHIWIEHWFAGGKDYFINRLKKYNPSIIINLCTKGDHSLEPGLPHDYKTILSQEYVKYCLRDVLSESEIDLLIKNILSNRRKLKNLLYKGSKNKFTLHNIVNKAIEEYLLLTNNINKVTVYEEHHPSY